LQFDNDWKKNIVWREKNFSNFVYCKISGQWINAYKLRDIYWL
jgi:hypothetical protein